MRRRLLIAAAVLFASGLLLVVTVPLWLGFAVRNVGPHWGVKVGKYERLGYGRFVAHDVEYRRQNVRVTAARVESDTPLLWWWRRKSSDAHSIDVDHWAVEVTRSASPSPAPSSPGSIRGWTTLRVLLDRITDGLERFLPRAKIGEGSVSWPGGGLTLVAATWEKRALTVRQLNLSYLKQYLPLDGTFIFPAPSATPGELRVAVKAPSQAASATLTDRAGQITGAVTWWDQPTTFTARYAAEGWLPAEAAIQADAWTVPASRLRLDALYSVVRARGRVDWDATSLRADLSASGEPLPDKKAPPLEATLRGQGDFKSFTVEALKASLPGIVADLSAPVTVETTTGAFRESAARFAVQVDLAQQPWFEATGKANIEASVGSPATGAPATSPSAPVIQFRASARDITAEQLAVAELDATGRFNWPRVEIETATLVGRGGERLRASGGWDIAAKELLPATVEGDLKRATLARWLPAQPQFETVTVKAQASGPLSALRHRGEAQAAGLSFPSVKPLAANVTWSGTGPALDNLSGSVVAAATHLTFAGAVDRDSLRLSSLALTQNDAPRLQLAQPATVRWRPALQIEGVRLVGPSAAVSAGAPTAPAANAQSGGLDADLTWGPTGKLAATIRGFSSTWLTDIITLPGPDWELGPATITGTWDRGPMTFAVTAAASIALDGTRTAGLSLSAQGDQSGVKLDSLRAAEGTEVIVNAKGTIPLVLTPGGPEWGRMDSRGALTLDAETAPNATFWRELTALTGVELVEPGASAHLLGTWEQPVGDITLRAARISVDPERYKRALPTMESLDVVLSGNRDGMKLDHLNVKIEGQPISARGRLPVADAAWARIFKDPLTLVRRDAEVHVDMPDVDIAAFSRFLPSFLAPKGRVTVALGYNNGNFDGSVKLSGAATRPLGPLGVVQDIEADIGLSGRTVELRSVTAHSGGEEVRLTGRAELPETPAAAPGVPSSVVTDWIPKFDLALKGENLPFVRQTGLLLRGDLDLKLTTPAQGDPRLTGTVRLRDSLFLQDVRSLLPTGLHSAARRPPYFSVETPPLDRWRLDVLVEGDEFMRLRTTLFNGVASARFRLSGTLGEPLAIGEATINDGRVLLPFATFDVTEGRVTLTREQPYEPQLWLSGTARRYAYDIRMELSGAATAPLLTFTSSPPLEHGQVLLMVMAGEAPKDEVTYSPTARAAALGAYLGQSLLSSFGESDKAERLSFSSGEKVSRAGRDTYQMEYRLTDKLSLTGEIDEFDEYNAGVKWRLYTKKGKPAEKADPAPAPPEAKSAPTNENAKP